MMKLNGFEVLLARWGSNLSRWPESERQDAEVFLQTSKAAKTLLEESQKLDFLMGVEVKQQPLSDVSMMIAQVAARSYREPQLPPLQMVGANKAGNEVGLSLLAAIRRVCSGSWGLVPVRSPLGQGLGLASIALLGFLLGWTPESSQLSLSGMVAQEASVYAGSYAEVSAGDSVTGEFDVAELAFGYDAAMDIETLFYGEVSQ